MGLHLTPNEPDDWANGPNDPEPIDCDCIDGKDEDGNVCKKCGGEGFYYPDPDKFLGEYYE